MIIFWANRLYCMHVMQYANAFLVFLKTFVLKRWLSSIVFLDFQLYIWYPNWWFILDFPIKFMWLLHTSDACVDCLNLLCNNMSWSILMQSMVDKTKIIQYWIPSHSVYINMWIVCDNRKEIVFVLTNHRATTHKVQCTSRSTNIFFKCVLYTM